MKNLTNPSPGATDPRTARSEIADHPAAVGERPSRWTPAQVGLKRAGWGILGLWGAAAALQSLVRSPAWEDGPAALGPGNWLTLALWAAGGLTILGLAAHNWRQLYRYLASVHASIVWIAALLVATALGTVILQAAPPAEFAARYGKSASLLQLLTLDDVFHGLPFRCLVAGLTLSSMLTVFQRRKTMLKWRHAGLLLTHFAVFVIVLGGLWGALQGRKGMVHLRVGEQSNLMVPQDGPKGQRVPLDFTLRLDKFELAHYVPEFKVYTWKRGAKDQPEAVTSEVPKAGQPIGAAAPGSRVSAKVLQVLQRARPVIEPTAGGASPHVVEVGGQKLTVEPGKQYPLADGSKLSVEEFLPDFTFDMQNKRATTRSDQPNNPALVVRIIGKDGQVPVKPRYLFGRDDMRKMMGGSGHGGEGELVYSLTDGFRSQIRWVEGKDGPLDPAIQLEITDASGKRVEWHRAKEETPIAFGPDRILVYREKPDGIRNYKSLLTILKDGKVVQTRMVEVNDPLYVGDYGLFQSNFDPEDPSYSGIQVVYDPGLNLAIWGLWLLVAGVIHTLALRNWQPWWERRRSTAATRPKDGGPVVHDQGEAAA